jgi:hypothetical protein
MTSSVAGRPGVRLPVLYRHVVAALPAWFVARVVVIGVIPLAHQVLGHGYRPPIPVNHHHPALLDWDADWYRRIARHGYAPLPRSALRFFPLWPLVARGTGQLFAGRMDWALIVLANALALVFGALIHSLTLAETGNARTARRATWLAALAPPAFVLVMGYSEALALCLSVAGFMALRRRRWWWAAAAGLLSGLCRPVGLLLAVPAAVEAGRGLRGRRRLDPAGGAELVRRGAAVVAPLAGAGLYLAWSWARFGDALLPFHAQQTARLRGHVQNPVRTLVEAVGHLARGDLGRQLHLPWVLAGVAFVVLVAYRLPASYTAYTGAIVIVAISAQHIGSLERYLYGAFPAVIAAAAGLRSEGAWRAAVIASAAGLAGYALAAFVGAYVP